MSGRGTTREHVFQSLHVDPHQLAAHVKFYLRTSFEAFGFFSCVLGNKCCADFFMVERHYALSFMRLDRVKIIYGI